MEHLAPVGDVYQAGTLSGNPLATAAGISVLRRLRDAGVYEGLERLGARLEEGLAPLGTVQRVGGMLTVFCRDEPVADHEDAAACDTERFGALFRHLLGAGRLPAAVAVRVPLPVARPHRRARRPDGRGRARARGVSVSTTSSSASSPTARRPRARSGGNRSAPSAQREPDPVFSRLVPDERFVLGLETIYEGYLLHYGRPRLFDPPDDDVALLLGDALLAHGLVRIAETGATGPSPTSASCSRSARRAARTASTATARPGPRPPRSSTAGGSTTRARRSGSSATLHRSSTSRGRPSATGASTRRSPRTAPG